MRPGQKASVLALRVLRPDMAPRDFANEAASSPRSATHRQSQGRTKRPRARPAPPVATHASSGRGACEPIAHTSFSRIACELVALMGAARLDKAVEQTSCRDKAVRAVVACLLEQSEHDEPEGFLSLHTCLAFGTLQANSTSPLVRQGFAKCRCSLIMVSPVASRNCCLGSETSFMKQRKMPC